MSFRLPEGGAVDRSRELAFSFEGRPMIGHPGDTIASALMANGVRLIGRSFKYHRPRGFFGIGLEDPNAMVAVRDGHGYDPALRAGTVPLAEGMVVCRLTGWPSPRFDLGALASLAAPLLRAGFYYKTFKWPNWSWFEGAIRRTTGFGRVRDLPDRRRLAMRHDTCDVLIVGAGPAGLAAAAALVGSDLRVLLVDDRSSPGGSLLWEQAEVEGRAGADWVAACVARLQVAGIEILSDTLVAGAYEGNFFTLLQSIRDESGLVGERLWKLRARHVVLASGAIERPLVFQNNDRPGVMLASAVRHYLGRNGVASGRTIAVHTNNDSGYLTAIAARRAGLKVPVLADSRSRGAARHADAVERLGIPCVFDAEVGNTSGASELKGVYIVGREGKTRHNCDVLAVAGGWTPQIQLAAQRGVRPRYDPVHSMLLCPEPPEGWRIVGGAAGALSLAQALEEGHAAGQAIRAGDRRAPRGACDVDYGPVSPIWRARSGNPSKSWVDLQHDVTAADIALAARENYISVEHLKRYTTLGMGTDQGRTSNVNGLALLARETGRAICDVGTTTFRPPYASVRLGAIGQGRQGDLYVPRRRMPAHQVHVAAGAVLEDFGWERPDWYRENGSDREVAVEAECAAVREAVGVFDSSPLGKIEIAGPDARDFLNRFYLSDLGSLKPGRVRYSVMLKEDGVVLDDGVVACLDETLFLASPTSGNAEEIAHWYERWRQVEWPGLRVAVAPVTSNWATIALAGPNARGLLADLEPDFEISNAAFGHMQFREGRIGGVSARIARVSFTGELQYEVSVPARFGAALFETAMQQGARHGARRIGIEAWLRLRVEKGYIHLGSDTNGRTTPLDLGMAALAEKKATDFIGKRSLALDFATSSEREQLVGLRAESAPLKVGARVLERRGTRPPCPTVGYVTSARSSPLVGHVALALVRLGAVRLGETVELFDGGETLEAEICRPDFLDPDNERLRT